jgi:alanyl-tRNA synthetase
MQITAALQSSSHQEGLALALEGEEMTGAEIVGGATIQRTLRHQLKDEGPHVLAVTVTYTETAAGAARTRTFRKLYQFVSQPLIAVRSKVTERRSKKTADAPDALREWILEAQLENVGDAAVVINRVHLKEKEGITSTAIGNNWKEEDGEEAIVLKSDDVQQVMFLVGEETQPATNENTARTVLAQLTVEWQSVMGEKGSLTTGWLAGKPR